VTETVKGIVEAIEKALQSAWKFGTAFFLIGLALHAGIYFTFIEPSAFSGQVASYASISVAVGIGLVAAAIIFWFFERLALSRAKWADHRDKVEKGKLAYQNLRYVPNTSLLILWVALHEPYGRMPSIGGIPSMRRLIELKIMEPEDAWKRYDEGALVSVNRVIYEQKDEIFPLIRQRWTDINLDDSDAVADAIRALVRSERGW